MVSGLVGFDMRPLIFAHLLKPSAYPAPPSQKSGGTDNNGGSNVVGTNSSSSNNVALPPLLGVFPAGHGSFSSQSSFEGGNNNSSNVSASQVKS